MTNETFTGSTFEEMVVFLRNGGVDVDTFDTRGAKTLAQLYQEVVEKEALLIHTATGIMRVAQRVLVLVKVGEHEWIRQTKRVYPNGKVVIRDELSTITETRIRGHTSVDTVMRGLQEECDLVVDRDQVRPVDPTDLIELQPHYNVTKLMSRIEAPRPSTVYPEVTTVNCTEGYVVIFSERPWPEDERVIDDCGVNIHLEYWRPGLEPVHADNSELNDAADRFAKE